MAAQGFGSLVRVLFCFFKDESQIERKQYNFFLTYPICADVNVIRIMR